MKQKIGVGLTKQVGIKKGWGMAQGGGTEERKRIG